MLKIQKKYPTMHCIFYMDEYLIKDNTLHIGHQYTLNDAVTAGIEIYYKTKIHKLMPVFWCLMVILQLTIIKVAFNSPDDFLLLGIPTFFALQPLIFMLRARMLFKKNPAADTNISYIFNQNGIEAFEDNGSNGFTPWKMIVKVDRRKKGIFIYPQPRIGQWIPIRAFESVSEIEYLEKLISENGIKYINRTRM